VVCHSIKVTLMHIQSLQHYGFHFSTKCIVCSFQTLRSYRTLPPRTKPSLSISYRGAESSDSIGSHRLGAMLDVIRADVLEERSRLIVPTLESSSENPHLILLLLLDRLRGDDVVLLISMPKTCSIFLFIVRLLLRSLAAAWWPWFIVSRRWEKQRKHNKTILLKI
jgi:hypothetical protein